MSLYIYSYYNKEMGIKILCFIEFCVSLIIWGEGQSHDATCQMFPIPQFNCSLLTKYLNKPIKPHQSCKNNNIQFQSHS